MRIPFGKYGPKNFPPSGLDICMINSGYLQWLIKEDWFIMYRDETLVVAVENELEKRDMTNEHFWDDKIQVKK